MNNPFINLRKFVPDRADLKENHATESLAACLQFSPILKDEFVRFLFGDTLLPFSNADRMDELEVSSQVYVGKFGILDLYLSIPDRVHIVVEVKVEAQEDERQLRDYSKWLKTQNGNPFLFSLVNFPNRKFRYKEFGVLHRRTWRDLYSSLQRFAPKANPTEQNIIRLFTEYLEGQQIVTTWKSSELIGMAKGMLAKKALGSIFETLSEKLPAQRYQTKSVPSDIVWSRLEIGEKGWERIFGKGYNNKLYLWFTVPKIWEATEHSFTFEIILWEKQHGNEWSTTQQRLKSWVTKLTVQKFQYWVQGRGINSETFDLRKSSLSEAPRKVSAYLDSATIGQQQLEKINEADLVNTLYDAILNHCKVIDALE